MHQYNKVCAWIPRVALLKAIKGAVLNSSSNRAEINVKSRRVMHVNPARRKDQMSEAYFSRRFGVTARDFTLCSWKCIERTSERCTNFVLAHSGRVHAPLLETQTAAQIIIISNAARTTAEAASR